jgi:zinc finger protein
MTDEDLTMKCPACTTGNLIVKSMMYSIPYFNELAVFTLQCPECGFYHSDVFSSEQRKPTRFTMYINEPEQLRTRVVRSSSGTLRFPEFGIDVEPGPQAESFISNIEGVLLRVKEVVGIAVRGADTKEEKKNGKRIIAAIEQAMAGEVGFTMVVEDPAGVSGILPEDMTKVHIQELTPEEASKLRGAPMFIDAMRDDYEES